jgi:hypothetical protein
MLIITDFDNSRIVEYDKKYVTFFELTNKIKYPIRCKSEKRVPIPLVIEGAIYETYY